MDKHEATQKHVKGLAAMHLPLPDAEQQHPECAGHNLDEGSCKLHPYKSSWLHWLSEGRPTLKPVEGREAENLMEVVVNEAASLTIRHSACDPAAGPLCKACSSLPKFANKEVCKWSYRLDLAQLAQLCVYQDRGTVLAALEELPERDYHAFFRLPRLLSQGGGDHMAGLSGQQLRRAAGPLPASLDLHPSQLLDQVCSQLHAADHREPQSGRHGGGRPCAASADAAKRFGQGAGRSRLRAGRGARRLDCCWQAEGAPGGGCLDEDLLRCPAPYRAGPPRPTWLSQALGRDHHIGAHGHPWRLFTFFFYS